jgi:hypothetical protein
VSAADFYFWWGYCAVVKNFFSEEKKQKTFLSAGARLWREVRSEDKSFLVLFLKKEPLALSLVCPAMQG